MGFAHLFMFSLPAPRYGHIQGPICQYIPNAGQEVHSCMPWHALKGLDEWWKNNVEGCILNHCPALNVSSCLIQKW